MLRFSGGLHFSFSFSGSFAFDPTIVETGVLLSCNCQFNVYNEISHFISQLILSSAIHSFSACDFAAWFINYLFFPNLSSISNIVCMYVLGSSKSREQQRESVVLSFTTTPLLNSYSIWGECLMKPMGVVLHFILLWEELRRTGPGITSRSITIDMKRKKRKLRGFTEQCH